MNCTLINLVLESLSNAENNKSKLNDELLNVFGMSGEKTRNFYNNLKTFYSLEIGAY